MRLFCIGHRPPTFRPRADFALVTPLQQDGFDLIIVPDDAFGAAYDGKVLSEYTQLFGLAQYLDKTGIDDEIYIFQYRKFLSLRQPSRLSSNLLYAFSATAAEAEQLFPTAEELGAIANARLLGPVGVVRSIARQYAEFHIADDFAAFVLALREVAGFDRQRCQRFIACTAISPAPSLGLIRVSAFLAQMRILSRAWSVFHPNFYVERGGSQRRVGGFLLERLHSFLLAEEAEKAAAPQAFGHHVVVSETAHIEPTA